MKNRLKSIKVKLFVGFGTTLLILIGLFLLANNLFLKSYYVKDLETSFVKHYDQMKDENGVKFVRNIRKLLKEEGIQSTIITSENEIIFDTMYSGVSSSIKNKPNDSDMPRYIDHLLDLKTTIKDDYIFKVVNNQEGGKDVVFIGKIRDDSYWVMYKSIAIIEDSAKVANRFFVMVGIIVFIIGSVIILVFSNQITKPIVKLNEITRKIANQDFTEKYVGNSEDEIGQLGESINIMSDELSNALDKIVRANMNLKDDLERKEAINKMREQFIANVSHELKTPIGIIRGYVEGLKYNVADNVVDQEKYYEVIINETEKMANMVKELLELSTIESEETKVNKTPINLTVLVEETVEKFKVLLNEKDICLELDAEKDYFVEVESSKIEQVISNYLNNAIHHVDENRQIKIIMSAENGFVKVEVFNTGGNIPLNDIENIWTSFYKVDKARTREYGGTGLGLAIVKAIIDKHDGKYGVENVSDGVVFYFLIEKYNEL